MKNHLQPHLHQCRKVSVLLLLMGFITFQLNAQQSQYPFSLDVNLGGGLIGASSVNTAIQPEVAFSYMPGKWGVGLNSGFISYNASFDADSYSSGFEEFTSVVQSKEKWSSFFISAGPRIEFGNRLPVQLRGGLDLSLTRNSPPDVSVVFDDVNGNFPDNELVLSDLSAGENYSKWSAAVRPEFQIQFSPGGSERFGINITTGIQHRISKNDLTYRQRDLSEVQSVDNDREMYFQFENAPVLVQSERPPKTNFFTTVGVKIKFGSSRAPAQDYNAARSNKPTSRAADNISDDCDDEGPCPKPDDAVAPAQDYNSSRSNKPTSRAADDISDDCDDEGPCPKPDDAVETAQDYNAARSNKPTSRTPDDINDDPAPDDDTVAPAQDYNSSRSNKPRTIADVKDLFDLDLPNSVIISSRAAGGNPLYSGSGQSADNPLYEGEANNNNGDMDSDNDGVPDHVEKARDLETIGQSIEEIKNVLDRCESDVCRQVRTNADHRTKLNRAAQEDARIANENVQTIRGIVEQDIAALGRCEADVCREVLAMEEQLLSEVGDYLDVDSDDDGVPDSVEKEQGIKVLEQGERLSLTGFGSFSISKRSARTGRNPQDGKEVQSSGGDSGGEVEYLHFDLELTGSEYNDWDGNGVPDIIENASFSISKRSARTGRNPQTGNENQSTGGDEAKDIERWHFDLEPDDPDSDGDGIMDGLENASFSISKRSARTGRNNQAGNEGESGVEAKIIEYWHFDLEFDDPDSDDDGITDSLENASFSISKRSARTGR